MLHVLLPVPFVLCSSFGVHKHSIPIGLVVLPFALVIVSVYVSEFSLTLCFIVVPVALIGGAIRPLLLAESLPHRAHPLSLVLNAILEPYQWLRNWLSTTLAPVLLTVGIVTLKQVVIRLSVLVFLLAAKAIIQHQSISLTNIVIGLVRSSG